MYKNLRREFVLVIALLACSLPILVVITVPAYKIHSYKLYSQAKLYLHGKYASSVKNLAIPTNFINPKVLQSKVANPAAWAITQIDSDFANYKDSSRENVRQTFAAMEPKSWVLMFDIKDGKLTVTKKPDVQLDGSATNGLNIYTNVLRYIAQNGYVNDVTFLVRFTDVFAEDSQIHNIHYAPILTTAKDTAKVVERDMVLIPDYMSLEDIPKLTPRIILANKTYPWHKKKNKILWRGGRADKSGFRHKVVEYTAIQKSSKKKPMLDAMFAENNIGYMSPEAQVQAKFLLSIDGHTAAWTRPIWQLLSNSVLVKQESTLTQWYYQALIPNVHYIPVASDPALLEREVLKFGNDGLQKIANNGSEFARDNLSIDAMVAYLVLVLQKYETLQNVSTTN